MDFFEAQDRAQRRTKWLVLLFILAVAGTILSVHAVVVIVRAWMDGSTQGVPDLRVFIEPRMLGIVSLCVIAVVGLGSLYKIVALGQGGAAVAESLGGRPVPPDTTDLRERMLHNIVEEMALASGLPVPAVYVLPDEEGINAFAAGLRTEHACVAVTQGALEKLTRDEVQGVVAHEFAHIRHGDMRLNVRLIGWLHGLLLIAIIGRGMMQVLRAAGRRRSRRSGKDGTAILAGIAAAGLALWIIGSLGVLFGRLIQAAVSRQREFMADAAAVELTRNPEGIAGALKKIGGFTSGGKVEHANAQETAHLFFANALSSPLMSVFATHPPIEERIRALDPLFLAERERRAAAAPAAAAMPAASGFAGPAGVPGNPPPPPVPPAPVDAAAGFIASLPETLRADTRQPDAARTLVCAVLLSRATDGGAASSGVLAGVLGNPGAGAVLERVPAVRALGAAAALPLVELAIPALRRLEPVQAAALADLAFALAASDGEVNLDELCLACVIEQSLALPGRGDPATAQVARAGELSAVVAPWLRMLSAVAASDAATRQRSWQAGWAALRVPPPDAGLGELPSANQLREAVGALRGTAPLVKRDLLAAFRAAVDSDGRAAGGERLLLRTLALAIGVPVVSGSA